jgi:hypothetical protein
VSGLATWALTLEILGGVPWNAPTDMEFHQSGEPAVVVRADWESRPFESPWYYAVRLGRARDGAAWSVELLHHKVYLKNPPPDVQSFSISHGLNFVTLQRSWPGRGFLWQLGGGLVIAHPESTVRGENADERGFGNLGYHATGPVLGAGVGRRVPFGRRLFLSVEGRATAARVRVPIADGHAQTANLALHLLIGFGVDLRSDAP